jgi:hypothetical protein
MLGRRRNSMATVAVLVAAVVMVVMVMLVIQNIIRRGKV